MARHAEFRRLRKLAGLEVEELEPILEISRSTAYRYDRGETKPKKPVLDALRREVERRGPVAAPVALPTRGSFTFIDLFAGIGGLRRGFEYIGGRCVFTSEWDKYSRKTYAANFGEPEDDIGGDVRIFSANPALIPEHDVLLAGFPCQPFSIAGVSKKNALGRPHGFLCDTQGTLFFDTAQIIQAKKPKAFLLENVKNLERHDGGQTFGTMLNVLKSELDYHVQHAVISSEYWVPQRRERIFIVGFRKDANFDPSTAFNFKEALKQLPAEGSGPVLGSILEDDVDPRYTLTDHLWNYLQRYKEKHAEKGNGFGCSVFLPHQITRTLSQRYYKDGSEILVDQGTRNPRRLTPRECARLMGFETKGGQPFLLDQVSDTQAYRQLGNAVVVPAVKFVAEQMKPHLMRALDVGIEVPVRRRAANG